MDLLLILKMIKFCGAVLVVLAAIYSFLAPKTATNKKRIILVVWMIAPPLFFYFEYYFQAPLLSIPELERFKDLQGLASGIWLGVATALAVAYFKKD